MSNFRRQFGAAANNRPTVTMSKARYVSPHTGEVSVVQTRGTKLENGADYYMPAVHKGHLKCFHCDTKVHHRVGPHALGGNTADGHDDHFATNPNQKHGDDCKWEFPEAWHSDIQYDPEKGFRIHINVPVFHPDALRKVGGTYNRVAGSPGIIRTNDESLRTKEPKSIGSADDIIDLIRKADIKRLSDSVVIFRNEKRKWSEFSLRRGTPSRYLDRINEMQHKIGDGAEAPVTFGLFEVNTDKEYYFPSRMKNADKKVKSLAINLEERDFRGKPQNVIVSLDLSGCHDARALVAFEGRDRSFMVLGNAVYTRHQTDTRTNHYFNIKITSVDQIAVVDVEDLWAKVRKKNGLDVLSPPATPTLSTKGDVMTSDATALPSQLVMKL